MKVALIHYWLVNWRGGERVLKSIAELFPDCDIYTHVYDPTLTSTHFPSHRVGTTFISKLPFALSHYQNYLPLMPTALEQLDLSAYDLVISSESGPAKGVVLSPHTTHVCYCHTPMRYVWDMYHEYRAQSGLLTRMLMPTVLGKMRVWDQVSAQRVDHFIANSRFVASRIHKYYRRNATVIHPPVAISDFQVSMINESFYLSVGQLVPYKRHDLLIESFNKSGKNLVVIGDGPLLSKVRKQAKSNIKVLGWQTSAVIGDYYKRCCALVFPGVEDFGIVPLEAMACGKPVIAFRRGGALETVVEGISGIFFDEANAASLTSALEIFEGSRDKFSPLKIRSIAEKFSAERFRLEFSTFIEAAMQVSRN